MEFCGKKDIGMELKQKVNERMNPIIVATNDSGLSCECFTVLNLFCSTSV